LFTNEDGERLALLHDDTPTIDGLTDILGRRGVEDFKLY